MSWLLTWGLGRTLVERVVNSPRSLGTAGVDGGLVGGGGLVGEGTDAGSAAVTGGLDGEGLAHDGTALGEDLQLGHGAAAGRGRADGLGTGSRRHGPESGGRGRLEERAHGLGLAKDGIHGGERRRRRSYDSE